MHLVIADDQPKIWESLVPVGGIAGEISPVDVRLPVTAAASSCLVKLMECSPALRERREQPVLVLTANLTGPFGRRSAFEGMLLLDDLLLNPIHTSGGRLPDFGILVYSFLSLDDCIRHRARNILV